MVKFCLLRICLLPAVAILASCVTTDWEQPYESPPQDADPKVIFQVRWEAYLDSLAAFDLQEGCRPRLVEPPKDIEYRGTVVLLHGYTGCPQQYFELAELLSLQGWRSVLPLLPGHGRQYEDPAKESIDDLPVAGNWESAYDLLADQMNGLMEFAVGDRVIGGLSVGGATSLYIHLRARDLYDRNIVFAPFFAPGSNATAGSAATVIANTPGVRQGSVKPFSVKERCLQKREDGRAGFCNYQLKHVGALTAMGNKLQKILAEEPLDVQLQFVGVENDNVVNNSINREFLAVQSVTGKTTACFYPEGVPHAMISRHDSPGIDMFWVDSLLIGAVEFITAGEPFAVESVESVSEAPFMLCATETERWN
jgi:pimeloyl-ACP methyl ester carboxylesterase